MSQYQEIRKDKEAWGRFMTSFVSIVHGKTSYARNSQVQLVSGFIGPSDEAFALLVLECYYNQWTAVAEQAKDPPEGRYITRKGNGRGYGWSPDGYRRYAELHKLVVDDCKGRHALEAEEEYRASQGIKKAKRASKIQEEYKDINLPYNF